MGGTEAAGAAAGASNARGPVLLALFQGAVSLGLLAHASDPQLPVWHPPAGAGDLLALSRIGAITAAILYLAASAWAIARRRRLLTPIAGLALLAIPFAFNWLWILTSPELIVAIGHKIVLGAETAPWARLFLGRTCVLAVFNAAVFIGMGLVKDGRLTRGLALHALLLACAAYAAATPAIADAATRPGTLAVGGVGWRLFAVVAAALAQAGLWVQTHLVTGALLDGLRGRRPTRRAAVHHAGEGLVRGAVFGGFFMALIQGIAFCLGLPGVDAWLRRAPLLGVALAGGLLFALARTVVESFDGSPPFFRRLVANALDPVNVLRGLVVGAGIGLGAAWSLPSISDSERTGFGLLVGAVAYAGVDLVCDAASIWRGGRQRLRAWRVYALGALLGGGVGAAIGWYLDASQLEVVTRKFELYAGVAPASTAGAARYVIYPLFSKWGAIDLGARLGRREALLRRVAVGRHRLVARGAAVQRQPRAADGAAREEPGSAARPVHGERARRRRRAGAAGAALGPLDGARHLLVPAAVAGADLVQPGRRRALHRSRRCTRCCSIRPTSVAGASRSSSACSPMTGCACSSGSITWACASRRSSTSRSSAATWSTKRRRASSAMRRGRASIPEGIRRFAHLGAAADPVLHSARRRMGLRLEWRRGGAQRARRRCRRRWRACSSATASRRSRWRSPSRSSSARRSGGAARGSRPLPTRTWRRSTRRFRARNGTYTLELSREGRGFSRVMSSAHGSREIDLTRRPESPLSLRGNFFYLRDLDSQATLDARSWSLAAQPLRRAGPDPVVTQPSKSRLRIVNSFCGVRACAEIEIDATDPVATWRIRLENLEERPRRIEITSYQELALDVADAYRRHPQLSALYVGTRFVAPLCAILAHDRRMHGARQPVAHRPVGFHAVRTGRDGAVRLTGYEDSRPRFIGSGTLREPRSLAEGRARAPGDEGLLHTFDPCASLRVEVALAPRGSATLDFIDGWVEDEREAPALIARHLGIEVPDATALAPGFTRMRSLDDSRMKPSAEPPYAFSADGSELRIHAETPRPFSHVIASPLGHGAILNTDGAIFSFAGNAQKNALTPFTLDTVRAAPPGQAIYLVPLADPQASIVFPQAGGPREIRFGRGYATFRQSRGDLRAELEVCVVPAAPVELRLLRIENRGARAARCRVAAYFEMVLAEVPLDSRGRLAVVDGSAADALFFSNPDNDFVAGVAFVATSLVNATTECLRARFVGGGGHDLSNPFLVERGAPDVDARDDGIRIASFAGEIEVPSGGATTVRIVLGQARSVEHARQLIAAQLPAAEQSALATRQWWAERLATLRIESNLPELDRLVNDWLPYQVQASRLWARAGSEQRSGAFGFRDQLQDVLPLLFHDADLARRQILLHAGQQFLEGDVLGWWHPSKHGATGLGARSRASDVHLWLAYVVARYVRATGDRALLDVEVPFIEGPRLARGADGLLIVPRLSRDSASVYEHCRRAIARTLAQMGSHGLPLLGSGDWNDALDRAGTQGRGESVWLGFFLHDVLVSFAELADQRAGPSAGDADRAEARRLRTALAGMWRGERFVRATTDAGEELVFADALTSAWPVLSGAVGFEQGRTAVENALRQLERDDLVLLLAPPFSETSRPDPGRIGEYPPGVRENGGQYSHGVSWLVDALVRLSGLAAAEGQHEEAARLRARAVEIWIKISPLAEMDAAQLDRYGVSPHQQPADVYFGPGYAGRGGWSWYTGGAARMLSAAYAILGLELRDGELVVPEDLFERKGPLALKRVSFRGRSYEAPR